MSVPSFFFSSSPPNKPESCLLSTSSEVIDPDEGTPMSAKLSWFLATKIGLR